ncbi:hypothetical protein PV08_02815 [Exophiala spinifera]|uniref:Zn(2)-C6 fungal-type domain-containing protein n=1 Tax=Exophiala spinifera TaxID=91928 RepID=A0A0D2A0Q4_9EURO|nr:uncharacterized protein PV08_02815 [Exophiala spinifera]KIW18527.1 hypothetical protein PV08_02815 [Exophiala spinifera]
MADFASLTTKFRADPSVSRVTKRPRDSLVCNQCRKSKLRCDKAQPCGSCVKRDAGAACSYHRPPPTLSESRNEGTLSSVAEDRLLHLEAMVRELMEQQASTTEQSSTHAVPSKLRAPHSRPKDAVDLECNETPGDSRYVGFTHWSAILDDIHELKIALTGANEAQEAALSLNSSTSTPPGSTLSGAGNDIIFGGSSSFSLEEILDQYLPPKIEVDRALAAYFRGETFIIPFVHIYQFQRQYREFCADPTKVNPLWLSILFSICYMASLIAGVATLTTDTTTHQQDDLVRQRRRFHVAAAKCLVLGNYRQPQPFALEALGIYGHCKNLSTLEPSREAGTILAIVVRMAYEMGYHRDPDHVGQKFTVFEAEMRRRFWAVCKQYDTMLSFQLGLPSSIVLENTDTKPPRHILDSDFDEASTELPPARSEDAPSPLLWFIVKDRMLALFSKVSRGALSFTERSGADVVALDREIRQVYDAGVPDVLRSRPLADSLSDSPFLIMTRFFVEFIHLKNLLVLHRRYMVKGSVSSTMACVEAGRSLVSQFLDMYKELGPGGQLYTERWMLNNFTINDFLLGVMVLCLVVHLCRQRQPRNRNHCDGDGGGNNNWHQSLPIDVATQREISRLLEQSYTVCVERAPACRDAWRVSHAIRFTLERAEAPQNNNSAVRDGRRPVGGVLGATMMHNSISTGAATATATATSTSSSLELEVGLGPAPSQRQPLTSSLATSGHDQTGANDVDEDTVFDFFDVNMNVYAAHPNPTSNNNNNHTDTDNDNCNDNFDINHTAAANAGLVTEPGCGFRFDSLNLAFHDLDDLDFGGWMSFDDTQISDS